MNRGRATIADPDQLFRSKKFTDEDNEMKHEHVHPVIEAVVWNTDVWLMQPAIVENVKGCQIFAFIMMEQNGASPFQEISQGAFDLLLKV